MSSTQSITERDFSFGKHKFFCKFLYFFYLFVFGEKLKKNIVHCGRGVVFAPVNQHNNEKSSFRD